jgi:hypothetical protein
MAGTLTAQNINESKGRSFECPFIIMSNLHLIESLTLCVDICIVDEFLTWLYSYLYSDIAKMRRQQMSYRSDLRKKNPDRKNVNTTLSQNLYKEIKTLAAKLDRPANDLLEEGMRMVLTKYKK